MQDSSFLLISSTVLPPIFEKVVQAKELISEGKAHSAAEASRMVGISRSAFYKYKDFVYAYRDTPAKRILSLHVVLRDRPGVLSSLITSFSNMGANILTVNQSIPISGTADVLFSANIEKIHISVPQLLEQLRTLDGVVKIESISGN